MSSSAQWIQRRRPGHRNDTQPHANATCQRCLQKGHWTFMCQNPPAYAKRISRTKIFKRPDLYKRQPKEEKPPEMLELEEELATVERQNKMMNDLLQSCNSDAESSDTSSSDLDSSAKSLSDSVSSSSLSSDSDTSSSSGRSATDSDSSSDEPSIDSRRHRERVRLGLPTAGPRVSRRSGSADKGRRHSSKQHTSRSRSPAYNSDGKSKRRHDRSLSPKKSRRSVNDFIHPDRRQFQRR